MQQNNWWILHLWKSLEFLLYGIYFVSEQQVLGIQKPQQEHLVTTQAVCNIYIADCLSSQAHPIFKSKLSSLYKNHNKKK
jgi:hypothetical protein